MARTFIVCVLVSVSGLVTYWSSSQSEALLPMPAPAHINPVDRVDDLDLPKEAIASHTV